MSDIKDRNEICKLNIVHQSPHSTAEGTKIDGAINDMCMTIRDWYQK